MITNRDRDKGEGLSPVHAGGRFFKKMKRVGFGMKVKLILLILGCSLVACFSHSLIQTNKEKSLYPEKHPHSYRPPRNICREFFYGRMRNCGNPIYVLFGWHIIPLPR